MDKYVLGGICLVASLLGGCVQQPMVRSGSVVVQDGHNRVAVYFSDDDRALIHQHYHHHLPPGLAKKATLPPGLRKQLAVKGTLPPGLSGRYLPHSLESRLSRIPDGYVRIRVGTDVILMNRNTRVIFDVIHDIHL